MKDLSVIVPTRHRNDLLAQCLDRLAPGAQTLSGTEYEVIVTDDGLEGDAKELVQASYPWARWVAGPKQGPAANRNCGAGHALGSWLVFTDDDCLPECDWLEVYSKAIRAGIAPVLEGSTGREGPQQRYDEQAPVNEKGNLLLSCNFAVNKSLFERVGRFDERFPYAAMEDYDLHGRLKSAGEVRFLPSARVIHPWRRRVPFGNFKREFISQRVFLKKHGAGARRGYMLSRTKLFLRALVTETIALVRFRFTGIGVYFERHVLNFCLIFA